MDMQTTQINMVQNAVKQAKYKLAQHRVQGQSSSLSIFQVARLMDTIKNGEGREQESQDSIFFSLN